MPVYGVILIEDELINDVIIVDDEVPCSALIEKYRDWNPIDLENYFISPGMIDINVRSEWESARHLTQSALSGGVTLIVEETSLYHSAPSDSDLYCDVGQLITVSRASDVAEHSAGVLGYKAYLFPPSPSTKAVEDLGSLVQAVSNSNLPLIIDVIKPSMRLYHEASPCHFMTLEERLTSPNISDSKIFAGAFPDDAEDSDVEEEPEEITIPKRTQSTLIDLRAIERSPTATHRLASVEEVDEVDEAALEKIKTKRRLFSVMMEPISVKRRRSFEVHDIFSDLDQRIRVSEQSIENLSRVEQFTYAKSGSTTFSIDSPPSRPKSNSYEFKKISSSFSLDFEKTPHSPMISGSPLTPVSTSVGQFARKRPAQLSIDKQIDRVDATEDCSSMYMFYQANFPEQWEVSGVTKLIEAVENTPCRVHVTCLSSASAINRIRRAQNASNLTCEVAASCLYFKDSDIARGDCRFKNSPPIRGGLNCNLLWDLLKMKGIHSLTSQHRGIHPTYKLGVKGSLKRALCGMNTLGFTLQQIWSKLRLPSSSREELEHYIVRLAKWLSLHPAKVLGIEKYRGSIERGMIADLFIWDPDEQVSVRRSHSQFNETCVLIGTDLYGLIHRVMLRGKFVFSSKKFTRFGRRVFKSDYCSKEG
jgi:dihydroorotase-like cyclic amidohydrolase